MKMIDVVERKRIEWAKDAIDETNKERVEIPASFMAIRRTTTNSGNALTFVAERSDRNRPRGCFLRYLARRNKRTYRSRI